MQLCMTWMHGCQPQVVRCKCDWGAFMPVCGCQMQACVAWMQNCQRFALHPADAQQRSEHAAECLARHKRVSSHAASRLMECSICMELVCAALYAPNKPSTASSHAPDMLHLSACRPHVM